MKGQQNTQENDQKETLNGIFFSNFLDISGQFRFARLKNLLKCFAVTPPFENSPNWRGLNRLKKRSLGQNSDKKTWRMRNARHWKARGSWVGLVHLTRCI